MAADGDSVAARPDGWDRRRDIAGIPLFWREAPRPDALAGGEGPPVLYLHGVPTNSDDRGTGFGSSVILWTSAGGKAPAPVPAAAGSSRPQPAAMNNKTMKMIR